MSLTTALLLRILSVPGSAQQFGSASNSSFVAIVGNSKALILAVVLIAIESPEVGSKIKLSAITLGDSNSSSRRSTAYSLPRRSFNSTNPPAEPPISGPTTLLWCTKCTQWPLAVRRASRRKSDAALSMTNEAPALDHRL
jgi:hypothetical protein